MILLEQKIKQSNNRSIGKNIREIRIGKGIGQTELVRLLDLQGTSITRECLVKIERGVQHIRVDQSEAIKDLLDTTFTRITKYNLPFHAIFHVPFTEPVSVPSHSR